MLLGMTARLACHAATVGNQGGGCGVKSDVKFKPAYDDVRSEALSGTLKRIMGSLWPGFIDGWHLQSLTASASHSAQTSEGDSPIQQQICFPQRPSQ